MRAEVSGEAVEAVEDLLEWLGFRVIRGVEGGDGAVAGSAVGSGRWRDDAAVVDQSGVGDPLPGAVVDSAVEVVLHLGVGEVQGGVFAYF